MAYWPTHKAKAQAQQQLKHSRKKRGRKVRKLYRDGKRGEFQ